MTLNLIGLSVHGYSTSITIQWVDVFGQGTATLGTQLYLHDGLYNAWDALNALLECAAL